MISGFYQSGYPSGIKYRLRKYENFQAPKRFGDGPSVEKSLTARINIERSNTTLDILRLEHAFFVLLFSYRVALSINEYILRYKENITILSNINTY